jgi:hypothetical protein
MAALFPAQDATDGLPEHVKGRVRPIGLQALRFGSYKFDELHERLAQRCCRRAEPGRPQRVALYCAELRGP